MDTGQLDVFFEIFKEVGFSFLTADLGRFLDVKEDLDDSNVSSYILVPIPDDLPKERRNAYISSFRGLINAIDVPDSVIELFLKSDYITSLKQSEQNDFERIIKKEGMYYLAEKNNNLLWQEETIWPALYSAFITHLISLTNIHAQLISKRVEELTAEYNRSGFSSDNVNVLSEYARNLPTGIQYAFASLGAWIGGAINFQYFAYYASIRQIHYADLNLSYLSLMGYNEKESKVLNDSGIVGLPASLVSPLFEAQQEGSIFGSISIDESNTENMSKQSFTETKAVDSEMGLPGFVSDKYYRATFRARKPSDYAFYGNKNVLRDHYQEFYEKLEFEELLRCKHYAVPIVDVKGIEEVKKHIQHIPIHNENGIFFRGQRKLYLVNRHDDVKAMLFGESCSVEPSLITSAARDMGYHYDAMHFSLRYFIEQKILKTGDSKLTKKWRDTAADPTCKLDMAIMALAQHYGIPSHGLDITNNLDVALWFATNIFQTDEKTERASYKKMKESDWPKEKKEWPVIIVCQTVTHSVSGSIHDCQELEDFGFKAARPAVQHARFFQGGHSDHQNRLAESVICVFRLAPDTHATNCSYSSLFPAPKEDPAYQLMLDYSSSQEFAKDWGKYVNKFHA